MFLLLWAQNLGKLLHGTPPNFWISLPTPFSQMSEGGGLISKGLTCMTGNHNSFDGFGGFGGYDGLAMTDPPLKLSLLFRHVRAKEHRPLRKHDLNEHPQSMNSELQSVYLPKETP